MTATTPDSASAEKLDMRRVLPIFVVVLVDLLGLTVIIPLLPLYAVSFQVSPFMIGVLNAAYPLMQLIGAPILGRLSDRYGRKPVLLASQLGTLVGFLVLGFANTFALLLVSRIIDGFSGGNIATAQAMIADSTTDRTRTQGLGLIGAAFGLGFIIGPIIAFAALTLSGNDMRVPAFIAAAFSAASIVLTAVWLKETHTGAGRALGGETRWFDTNAALRRLRYPHVGVLLLLMFAQQFAFGGLENLLPLFTVVRLGLDSAGNALVFVFVGVFVVAVQGGLIGRWSRRYGERRLILAGIGLLAIGLALTAATPAQPVPWYDRAGLAAELNTHAAAGAGIEASAISLPDPSQHSWAGLAWLLVAMVPTSIGAAILGPSVNSLITRRVGGQERGSFLGLSAGSTSAANVVTPLFGFGLFQAIGASAPMWCYALVMALLLAVAARVVTMPETAA
jgi:DHA1 family tetracycline resistance protein-like MFS transporter